MASWFWQVDNRLCVYVKQNFQSLALLRQVLTLTHEKASGKEIEPYAQALFNPVPVLSVYGRTASASPPCHKKHAVFFGWRDCSCVSRLCPSINCSARAVC
jgi:hypothetical protein